MFPSASPQQMLPPQAVASMVRSGGSPGQIFQQNPLSQNMTSGAMGTDPTLMNQPQAGTQDSNPTMPGQPPTPQAGMQQPNGQPGSGQPQISEAQYILNVLADRLSHHSKITQKTVNTLSDMITAQLPQPDQSQQNTPTA